MRKANLKLTKTDKEYLESILRKGQLSAKTFKRATGLLELDSGKTFETVAATLRVTRQSVDNWRDRYNAEGLKCLQDKPRSGRPVEISGKQRAKITALACSPAPDGRARWDLRLLADKVVELGYCENISYTHVRTILKKMNSNPTSKKRGA
jgi:putative transposase